MKYKNVSGGHLQIGEYRFLDPNVEIDLDEDDLRTPMVKSAGIIGWLIPVVEAVIPTPSKSKKAPKQSDVELNEFRKKAIEQAIAEAAKDRRESISNPNYPPRMPGQAPNYDGFGDYLADDIYVNSKIDYGNTELESTVDSFPTVHAGDDGIGQVGYLMHHPDDIAEAQRNKTPAKQELPDGGNGPKKTKKKKITK